jgi:hypothetical protein
MPARKARRRARFAKVAPIAKKRAHYIICRSNRSMKHMKALTRILEDGAVFRLRTNPRRGAEQQEDARALWLNALDRVIVSRLFLFEGSDREVIWSSKRYIVDGELPPTPTVEARTYYRQGPVGGWPNEGQLELALDGGLTRNNMPNEQWPEPVVEEPSEEELELWATDSIIDATDGCRVEPDGVCEHGHPSWLLKLGLI